MDDAEQRAKQEVIDRYEGKEREEEAHREARRNNEMPPKRKLPFKLMEAERSKRSKAQHSKIHPPPDCYCHEHMCSHPLSWKRRRGRGRRIGQQRADSSRRHDGPRPGDRHPRPQGAHQSAPAQWPWQMQRGPDRPVRTWINPTVWF